MSALQGAGRSLIAFPDAPYPWKLGDRAEGVARWIVSDDGVEQALVHDLTAAEAIIRHVNGYHALMKALAVLPTVLEDLTGERSCTLKCGHVSCEGVRALIRLAADLEETTP